ncbi:hypothetical protein HanXRQr2_Chr11g0496561 [Helianthus annuus]|uniref:Uncharacterized protein n=1 Tax=Helianthus annuus TaxID=4232 RepID=A0A251TCV7_HELAN|nr:hypothetical protein HanXRQr2_Chr11g0496561 [Helianthus annuus]KAJ0875627.1 hypothetical protein HanPSC8_Chr11g0478601 [Helianthus annuus]
MCTADSSFSLHSKHASSVVWMFLLFSPLAVGMLSVTDLHMWIFTLAVNSPLGSGSQIHLSASAVIWIPCSKSQRLFRLDCRSEDS